MKAAEALQRTALLERCEIQWIGAKDEKGQGFHTGKSALDHTLAVMRANSALSPRQTLLLYDNDANKSSADYDTVSVRSMPTNNDNATVRAGIENLLEVTTIRDDDYQTTESKKPNGEIVIRKTLRKEELKEKVCSGSTTESFSGFSQALDLIEEWLDKVAPVA